jgi:hypothetical protein
MLRQEHGDLKDFLCTLGVSEVHFIQGGKFG